MTSTLEGAIIRHMTIPDWQPIETAPKDRELLLCAKGYAPTTGSWHDGQWITGPAEDYDLIKSLGEDPGDYEPTHWTEVPPGP